jgi:hypothetical protein
MAGLPLNSAAVDPYESRLDRSYRSLAGSISRAFAVPKSTYVAPTYRSTLSETSVGGGGASGRSGGRAILSSGSDNRTWGVPSTRLEKDWSSPAGAAIDPDARKLRAARLKVWQVPQPPHADLATIAHYYVSQGVPASLARGAAEVDLQAYAVRVGRRNTDTAWRAHDEKQRTQQAHVDARRHERAEYNAALGAVRQAALASPNKVTAKAWLELASAHQWKQAAIDHDPAAYRDAVLFAAGQGLPNAYFAAWTRHARNDPAGWVWRDKSALEGSLQAGAAAFEHYRVGPHADFAAGAALFEKVLEQVPDTKLGPNDPPGALGAARMMATLYLVRLYAQGDDSLPADANRALQLLQQLPVSPPSRWQEWQVASQARALPAITANAYAARAIEPLLLVQWQSLAALDANASATADTALEAQLALFVIYSGQDLAFPRSRDPAKAAVIWNALAPRLNPLWRLRALMAARDWPRTAEFDAITPEAGDKQRINPLLGRLWRDRTDGKADTARAIAYHQRAMSFSGGSVDLAESYLAAGEPANALETLRKGAASGWQIESWQARLRLALMHYRGESGTVDVAQGDEQLRLLKTALRPPNTADERALERDFAFHSVAAPLTARRLQIEAEMNAAGLAPDTAKARLALHRANVEPALKPLRELGLSGHAQALRLWAVIVLSGDVNVSNEDAAAARQSIFLDAQNGDDTAVSILAQRLYLDAQSARQAAGGVAAQARFSEAADWLEASVKSGDDNARWALATIYSEGLGRTASVPKAREQLLALLQAGQADAKLALDALGSDKK